jgi:multiple sugar transport system ATP-binding protein
VAGFIGSPAMNFLPSMIAADGASLVLDLGTVRQTLALGRALQPGRKVTAGIRPEHIVITAPGEGNLDVPVAVVESTGSSTFITADTVPEMTIVETGRGSARAGEVIGLKVDPAQLHIFDEATGFRI